MKKSKKQYYLLSDEYTGQEIGVITFNGNVTNFNNRVIQALTKHPQYEFESPIELDITPDIGKFDFHFTSDDGEGYITCLLIPIDIY